jgi:zinc transport system substrate-binding protein
MGQKRPGMVLMRIPRLLTFILLLIVALFATACEGETASQPTVPPTSVGATDPQPTVPPTDTGATGDEAAPPPAAESAPLQITVSIQPQAYFVERVGGDHVAVTVMVPPGGFPGTYEPKPEQLTALSNANAYISIDVPFERAWLERFRSTNPDMLMVDTTQGIERHHIGEHEHEGEDEGGHEDEAGQPDPHIWLSPSLVKVQARTIADALIRLDPAHKADFEANLARFLADIDALHQEITTTLESLETRKFMVFHPAWGYFAQDYNLEMIPVEVGGQEPSAAELGSLIQQAKAEQIKIVFAQPQFNPNSAQTIADEIGGEVMLIDPLAHDWLANLQSVADTFATVLAPSSE